MSAGIPLTSFDGSQAPSLDNATWFNASAFLSTVENTPRNRELVSMLFPKPDKPTKREIKTAQKAARRMAAIYDNANNQGIFQ